MGVVYSVDRYTSTSITDLLLSHAIYLITASLGWGSIKTISMNRKSTTALLAVFGGALGVHRFYLNQPLRGALILLFSAGCLMQGWMYLTAIISLIEFVNIVTTPEGSSMFTDKENNSPVAVIQDTIGFAAIVFISYGGVMFVYFLYRMAVMYWFK